LYTHVHIATSLAEVRRQLAEADEEDIRRGNSPHEVPASIFIHDGLDIEERQYVPPLVSIRLLNTYCTLDERRKLASAIKKKPPKSDNQIASTQETRNAIMRRIKKWRELQLVYMPGVAATLLRVSEDNAEDNEVETAENIPLLLPSSLDSESRARNCIQRVVEHEQLQRTAQLKDSLTKLRHARNVRRTLIVNHHTQVAGQRAGTRSRAAMDTVENRIDKYVGRYRIAYRALLGLDPAGDWRETFLELKDGDNRGPGKESNEEGVGDGSYFRSWIWLTNPRAPGAAGEEEENASEEDVNELLRVEWTTSFARLERWTEEVELLQEEMRRVVAFLEWKSVDWLAKIGAREENTTPDLRSGLDAYARKQAAVYHDLAVSFATLWRPTLVSYNLKYSWATEYMTKHGIPLTDTNTPVARARGIFKFRLSDPTHDAVSTVTPTPSEVAVPPPNAAVFLQDAAVSPPEAAVSPSEPAGPPSEVIPPQSEAAPPPSRVRLPPSAGVAIDNIPLLETGYREDSDSEDNDLDSEVDLDDDYDDPDF